ncbi:MAG: CAP domain-containing protein, partial [Candidatus Fimadaptatus sp.]
KPTQAATAAPTATAKPTSPAQSGSSNAAMARQVFEEVNRERAAAGLAALELDDGLSAAAQIRAGEITRSFSHTRPDGSSFSTVTSGAYGENIAKGQSSAARVMAAWMSSSGHRANILNARYTRIGICAYEYGGVMYWVQLFGR